VNLGDAFVNRDLPGFPPHLWIVVSRIDAQGQVVICNFSSDDGGCDGLPAAEASEHPWLKYTSYVRCERARLARVDMLRTGFVAHPKDPASPALVARLQKGLVSSKHTRREVKAVLLAQGFGV
jgi:hypothetical protein